MKDRGTYQGKHFGKYKVTAKIACGASGCVYLAQHDMFTKRIVAIKVMHTAHVHSSKARARFIHEAEILGKLSHPHFLLIYDFGIDDEEGLPYLVLEYAPNGSLRDLLNRHSKHLLPVAQSLTIITQVGEALQYAHQMRIVHRDLKPENILFNAKSEALLTDFSIAIEQDTTSIQNAIEVMGTPSYMAPEQFDGHASRRSDQYALGCISYELFTGRKPFQAHNTAMLLHKQKYENPIPLTNLNPHIPISIEQSVLKATSKRRINRYVNVSQFIKDLRGASFSHPTDTTVPDLSQFGKWQWLIEGIQLRKSQRYMAALEADEQALFLDFNFSPAHNNKGISLYYLKRYDAAIVAFEQAITLDSNFALAYHGIGIIFIQLGRYPEALDAYERAIQIDANKPEFHYSRGNALQKLGKIEEAQRAYDRGNRLQISKRK